MALVAEDPNEVLALHTPEVLSDEQIEELLQEAETRLRAKAGQVSVTEQSDDLLVFEHEKSATHKEIRFPKLEHNFDRSSYIKNHNGVAKVSSQLTVPAEQRDMANSLRSVMREGGSQKLNDKTNAGSDWFNLPKTEVTTALKRDLQLIEMRNVLDPHRHYKKNNRKGKVPTFSQVGTVIEGPTEWYSSRINRKDRAKNFVEEEMRGEAQTGRFKRKYNEIQDAKTSGKKAHYKKLLAKRKKSR